MRIEDNRRALDSRPVLRRWFSPAVRGLEQSARTAIARHASGAAIDVGCGAMPYRPDLEAAASSYASLDIEPRTSGLDYQCSVTDMAPVADAAYDTALCSEVLEHVAEPDVAVGELARILSPGGRLIVTVPFLARLHEELGRRSGTKRGRHRGSRPGPGRTTRRGSPRSASSSRWSRGSGSPARTRGSSSA